MLQKYYGKINYENGYCGCDETEYHIIEAVDEEDAKRILEEIADEDFCSYMESYSHVAEGYDWFNGWETEEDEEAYYSGGYCSCGLVSKEEYDENN